MTRPRKFAQRIMVRLTEQTLALVQALSREDEDRSDYVRTAVELENAVRGLDVYSELETLLTANETKNEFCAKAVRRAILRRKSAIADEADSGG